MFGEFKILPILILLLYYAVRRGLLPLEALAAERQATEEALVGGDLSPADIADHGRRLNHIAAETSVLEERWLALSEQLEAMQATAG